MQKQLFVSQFSVARMGASVGAVLFWILVVGNAQAALVGIDPAAKALTCETVACDSVLVQVTLVVNEASVNGFEFELDVSNAGLVGWTSGQSVGFGTPDMNGDVVLQADGTTLIGSFISNPVAFHGPVVVDVAVLELQATGTGVTQLSFTSAEISCSSCNGGLGQIYPTTNLAGQPLSTISVVLEPAAASLLGFGLLALAWATGRRGSARIGG